MIKVDGRIVTCILATKTDYCSYTGTSLDRFELSYVVKAEILSEAGYPKTAAGWDKREHIELFRTKHEEIAELLSRELQRQIGDEGKN